jgi:hypothetical protein
MPFIIENTSAVFSKLMNFCLGNLVVPFSCHTLLPVAMSLLKVLLKSISSDLLNCHSCCLSYISSADWNLYSFKRLSSLKTGSNQHSSHPEHRQALILLNQNKLWAGALLWQSSQFRNLQRWEHLWKMSLYLVLLLLWFLEWFPYGFYLTSLQVIVGLPWNAWTICTYSATKIKWLKLPSSRTESDVSVHLAS